MSPKTETPNALLLHVHLEGITPPIWRRLLVPPEMSLGDLHQVLQAAMGWEDEHSHDFRQGKGRATRIIAIGDEISADMTGDEAPNEHDVKVGDVLSRKGSTFTYVYDLGDHWSHVVRLEDKLYEEGLLPRCVAGERAAPLEDCGGIPGYTECLEAFQDPSSSAEKAEWIEEWDPERFSIEEVNLDITEHLLSANPQEGALSMELLEFLTSPVEFGVSSASIDRFRKASAELLDMLLETSDVVGYLFAPEAGFPRGVLATAEDEDLGGLLTMALFESAEEFVHETPGEDHDPRRVLAVSFQPTSYLPPVVRRSLGTGMLPVPAAIVAETLKPPNQEELDMLSACLEILTECLGQWDPDDALPPSVAGSFDIAGRVIRISFEPDPDLLVRDTDDDADGMGLSFGSDALYEEESDDDEEDDS